MADEYTPNLGLTKPDVGHSDDTWGEKLNTNFDLLDAALNPGAYVKLTDFPELTDDRVAAFLQAGDNVTLTYDDAANTLTIASTGGGSGGGASVTISDTPPADPLSGNLWWESDTGILYIYYDDGSSAQWVAISGGGSGGIIPSILAPLMDGVAAPGVALPYSREDHVHPSDTSKVSKSGDTMTGPLTTSDAITSSVNIQGLNVVSSGGSLWAQNSANTGDVQFGTSGGKRIHYDGTDFNFFGGWIKSLSQIHAAGNITSAPTPTTGTYYFGNTGSKFLGYDGASFSLNGGSLYVAGSPGIVSTSGTFAPATPDKASFVASGAYGGGLTFQDGAGRASIWSQSSDLHFGVQSPAISRLVLGSDGSAIVNYVGHQKYITVGAGSYYDSVSGADRFFAGTDGTEDMYRIFAGGYGGNAFSVAYSGLTTIKGTGGLNIVGDVLHIGAGGGTPTAGYGYAFGYGGTTRWGFSFRPASDGGSYNAITFANAAAATIGSISCSSTATAFVTSSSGELKEDLKSFDAGRIIDDTKVYDFKWRSTGERSYGVIAQQAIEVYPMAVSHLINPQDKDDEMWGVDYSKYVPVLLQELKALRTRVAELETKLEAKAKR